MSIYDKASLVLIPSGTKTSKVYSQKPVNGDGDFTFSRSTAATRINADGNIEKETQNLLLQSNSFDTTWATYLSSVTGNQTGYDGSSDAWLLTKSGVNGFVRQFVSVSGLYTFSVYAKAGSLNFCRVYMASSVASVAAYVDLTDGSVGTLLNSPIDVVTESVGGGWYRISITHNDSGMNNFRIYPAQADNDASGTSGNIYIQDAQLEQGMVARDYIETTTAAVEGGITDNVPRLDYTDSSCPALLLEPQRTNLIHYGTPSAFLSASTTNYWRSATLGTTDEVNATIGVDGYQSATQYKNVNSASTDYMVYNSLPVTSGSTYTLSGYVKLGTATNACIVVNDTTAWNSVTNAKLSLTAAAGYDEWKRFEITFTAPSTNKVNIHIGYHQETGITAQSTGTFFVDSFQLEEGSYATSYIPTYGTSVTRNLEYMIVTSLDTNSIITDNDSWSAFFEVELLGNESPNDKIQLSDNSNTPRGYLYGNTAGVAGTGWSGSEALTINTNNKIMYRANSSTNISFFENGVNEETFTSTGDALTFNRVNFYGSNGAFRIKRAILFPTALTDQEAIDLTTI